MKKVRIIEVKEKTELYCRYDGQYEPQQVFIELDPSEGTVAMRHSELIGGGISMSTAYGLIREYAVRGIPTAERANEIMEELLPIFERVCTGFESRWDGSNWVGRLSADAEEAEEEIYRFLHTLPSSGYIEEGYVEEHDVDDWLQEIDDKELGIAGDSSDEKLREIASATEDDADALGVVLRGDLMEYLQRRREKAAQ